MIGRFDGQIEEEPEPLLEVSGFCPSEKETARRFEHELSITGCHVGGGVAFLVRSVPSAHQKNIIGCQF